MHARALINWLVAMKTGGQFILRYDDTDQERSRKEYADNIAEDLAWLGVTPDRVERQSERMEAYDKGGSEAQGYGTPLCLL